MKLALAAVLLLLVVTVDSFSQASQPHQKYIYGNWQGQLPWSSYSDEGKHVVGYLQFNFRFTKSALSMVVSFFETAEDGHAFPVPRTQGATPGAVTKFNLEEDNDLTGRFTFVNGNGQDTYIDYTFVGDLWNAMGALATKYDVVKIVSGSIPDSPIICYRQ